MNNIKNYIPIGMCKRPHGLKGALVLELYYPFVAEILHPPLPLLAMAEGAIQKLLMTHISLGPRNIIQLQEVVKIEDAQKIVPFEVSIPRELFPLLPKDEFYPFDLLDKTVMVWPNGRGTVESFYHNGAHYVLVINQTEESWEVPMIPHFVKQGEKEEIIVVRPEFVGGK